MVIMVFQMQMINKIWEAIKKKKKNKLELNSAKLKSARVQASSGLGFGLSLAIIDIYKTYKYLQKL